MSTKRFRIRAAGVLAILAASFALLAGASNAEARHRRHWRWDLFGAVVAGAVIADAVAHSAHPHVHHGPPVVVPAYPPPPHYYHPPQYHAPPPAVYAAPPPRPEFPRLGLAIAGTVQDGRDDLGPVGGVTAALQMRTSRHSLLAIELQSVGVRRRSDESRRNDFSALLAGRIFPWNAALAPYLEIAGGAGRTAVSWNDGADRASAAQLLGRLGLGLELRLGSHIVLDASIAQLHRWRLDEGDGCCNDGLAAWDGSERATEVRGGIGFRF